MSRRTSLVIAGVIAVVIAGVVLLVHAGGDTSPTTVRNDGRRPVVKIGQDDVAWALRGSELSVTDLDEGPESRRVHLRGRRLRVICSAKERSPFGATGTATGLVRLAPHDRPARVRLSRALPRVTGCVLQAPDGGPDLASIRFVTDPDEMLVIR